MVGCNFHSEVQLIGGSECSKDRLESSIYWKRIQMYLGFGVHRCRPGRIIIIIVIDVMIPHIFINNKNIIDAREIYLCDLHELLDASVCSIII